MKKKAPTTNMKIKMPCKLCELSLVDQQKFGTSGCTHTSPFLMADQLPPVVQPLRLIHNNPFMQLPQIRDMMLAAYLLTGEIYF